MKSVISQLPEISRLYYEEGLSVRQIAARLRIPTPSIYYHASKGRIVFRKRKKQLDGDVLREMRVDQGLPAAEIAKLLNTNSNLVYAELKRFGIPGPALGRPRGPFDVGELRRLYVDELLPVREVAARMNCHPEKVRWEMKRAGIEARPLVSDRLYKIEPQIKIGQKYQSRGLPRSAKKYRIQLETKQVGKHRWRMIGMAEVSRLYHSEELEVREIAKMLGVTTAAIYYRVGRGHLFLEPRQQRRGNPARKLDDAELRKLYVDQKLGVKEIAALLGYSRWFITKEIKRHGIARPFVLARTAPGEDKPKVAQCGASLK